MNFLRKISNWKTLGILFVIYVLFAVFVMSGMMGSGDIKITPLDLLFSYSPERAYALLSSYGELREHYAFMSLTADTAYPIIYTVLFMVLLMVLAKSLWPDRPNRHRLALVPLFAFVFDLIENHNIRTLLHGYPEKLDGVVKTASTFTSLKWISVGTTFALIILLVLLLLVKRFKK
ncbi:MAG: hypothetical protein JKX72_04360 [Robiginitomaculum sp.]|nr:hypothetical protein [Robiginitomaculum sp.]